MTHLSPILASVPTGTDALPAIRAFIARLLDDPEGGVICHAPEEQRQTIRAVADLWRRPATVDETVAFDLAREIVDPFTHPARAAARAAAYCAAWCARCALLAPYASLSLWVAVSEKAGPESAALAGGWWATRSAHLAQESFAEAVHYAAEAYALDGGEDARSAAVQWQTDVLVECLEHIG